MSDKKIGFLFDLDGVLLDSERTYTEIWADINRVHPTGVENFPRVIKGKTLADILSIYFPDEAVAEDVMKRCIEAEKHIEFHYMPGAVELLERLKALDIPRALVTSSDEVKMASLVKKMPDILDRFNAVVYGEMVKHGKPDPEPYLLGARLLGLSPQNCVVFEDALTGIASGKSAGCFVVGMSDTLGREAIEGKADIVFDSLEEINVAEIVKLAESNHGNNASSLGGENEAQEP